MYAYTIIYLLLYQFYMNSYKNILMHFAVLSKNWYKYIYPHELFVHFNINFSFKTEFNFSILLLYVL